MSDRLRVLVLGSAAGGGYPQWNCRCPVCALYWAGDPRVHARTQSSIAVSADARDWLLLNCSPDIRSQILASPALQPAAAPRGSPISAVCLTNADVDHVAGLLSLRERQAFSIYATAATLDALAANPLFEVLDLVRRHAVDLESPFELAGLSIRPFAIPGKCPLYLESEEAELRDDTGGWSIGLEVTSGNTGFSYLPGCAEITEAVAVRLRGAELVLFDGTFWRDDEMVRLGLGTKTARRMGHVPMSGPDGAIARLAGLDIRRKVFIHINNSNPVLIDGSPERRALEASGWELAYDGMEIRL